MDAKIVNDESKTYTQFGFNTIRHPVFTDLEKNWYRRNNGEYEYKIVGSKLARKRSCHLI
jgi:hypothetical protein